MAGEAFGERRGLANGFFHDVGEFGGVGGRQNEALGIFGVFLAVGFPGVDADSGVRVGDVAIAIPDSMHFVESFLVGGAVSPNLLTNIFKAIAAEIEQAWKIVGISDVHGI